MSEPMTNYVWPTMKVYREDMDENYHFLVEPSGDFPEQYVVVRAISDGKQEFEFVMSATDQAALVLALGEVRSLMKMRAESLS